MAKVSIVGIEKVEVKLRKNVSMQEVKQVVRRNGKEMNTKIQENADFKKGYQTGTTKASVRQNITDGGMTTESGATTKYAGYLEHGTRKMEAQPFVKPAFDDQKKKFVQDMRKLTR